MRVQWWRWFRCHPLVLSHLVVHFYVPIRVVSLQYVYQLHSINCDDNETEP